jgi:uncharacterized protein
MEFEYNPDKSGINRQKHGIDFEEAKTLWDDPKLLIIPARTLDEVRYLAIGRIKEKIWSLIFTNRKQNIRIISCRRSRKEEEVLYESRTI